MDDKTVDTLAEAQLERHKSDILYAERQLIKAGDYEAVARNLRRRKYIALCISCAAATVFLVGRMWMWAALIAGGAAYEYAHARRTHETLRRWQQISSGDSPSDERSA